MEAALWEPCNLIMMTATVFFPLCATGVLLSCNSLELLQCNVAEMLVLDFRSGVVFPDLCSIELPRVEEQVSIGEESGFALLVTMRLTFLCA